MRRDAQAGLYLANEREHPDVSDKILQRIQADLGEGGIASARLLPTAEAKETTEAKETAEAEPEEIEAVKEKVGAKS